MPKRRSAMIPLAGNLANVGYQSASSFAADQVVAAGSQLEAWPKLVAELESQLKPLGVKASELRAARSCSTTPRPNASSASTPTRPTVS